MQAQHLLFSSEREKSKASEVNFSNFYHCFKRTLNSKYLPPFQFGKHGLNWCFEASKWWLAVLQHVLSINLIGLYRQQSNLQQTFMQDSNHDQYIHAVVHFVILSRYKFCRYHSSNNGLIVLPRNCTDRVIRVLQLINREVEFKDEQFDLWSNEEKFCVGYAWISHPYRSKFLIQERPGLGSNAH